MPFVHGKSTVFKIDDSAGALTDISAFCMNVGFPRAAGTAEVTTFGDADKEFIPGLKEGTISIEGKWDPTVDALLNGILGHATSKTFEYGPAGSAGGSVKYTGECILTSYEDSSPVEDAAGFTAEFQITGAVTRTTF